MTLADFFNNAELLFTLYLVALYSSYAVLNFLSIKTVWQYMQMHSVSSLPTVISGMEYPVSILVPGYNEELSIADSVRALLQMNYSEFEVVVINDGSKDRTLEVLINEFDLVEFPQALRVQIKTANVRGIYVSRKHQNLRVIDKENGGKADALNVGINAARYPLFCAVDADSILQPDSLTRIVLPFLEDPLTIAAGGTVRIANGCVVDKGVLKQTGLPTNILALYQVVEYLRGFLFGRLGWSPLNALLIVSGAFGVFSKQKVVDIGGYRHKTIGEDMELVVRLHRHMREKNIPYRITFVPDPICWTEAPQDFKTLRNQRIRWQIGLSESLFNNIGLMFSRHGGAVGWLAFPYMLIFEWLGPVIEVMGFTLTILGFVTGYLQPQVALLFLLVSVGFGMLLSVVAVLLEEMSFHQYPKLRNVFVLFAVAFLENIGYRQLISYWRLVAMIRIAMRRKTTWGKMVRNASWQGAAPAAKKET